MLWGSGFCVKRRKIVYGEKRLFVWIYVGLWNKAFGIHGVSIAFRIYIRKRGECMDQISTKTPNLKCRLYCCLIEVIDWKYSQSCWYFRPFLWTSAPLNFSLVHLPHSPPSCVWISTGVHVLIQCVRGGGSGPQTDKHLPPSTFTGQFLRNAEI